MNTRIALMLTLLSGSVLADDTMFVQSTSAKLFKDRSFSSPVVLEIERGETVQVSETAGRWAQVHYKENSGWMSTLLLSKNPPMNKVSVLSEDKTLGGNARRRASAVATAGATRGLTSDNRQRASESVDTNYRALLMVEQERVSESELHRFKEEMSR